jgi:hypothetical protein
MIQYAICDLRFRAGRLGLLAAALVSLVAASVGEAAAPSSGRGQIKGHIKLSGPLPGNPVIRMGMDPMCARINAGKRVIQETVVAALDGSLANAFIRLRGDFPATPVPTAPVVIDQVACIYRPRVVGIRVGQTLQVKNSDPLLHNVHSLSAKRNTFNVGEPIAGMVQPFVMKDEEVMLQIKCDVHSWMTTFVGVVSNPYFAVSDDKGTFQIDNVPPGMYMIEAWQERYGTLAQTVRVKAGATAAVEFTYTNTEKPPAR